MPLSGPVARAVYADPRCRTTDNPRGWMIPAGTTDIAAWAMRQTAEAADRAAAVEAPVFLVIDPEGQQRDHPVSYVGDPRDIHREFPAKEVCDYLIGRGFRVGMTVRHTAPSLNADTQLPAGDPYDVLAAKVEYARVQFGVTVAYLDSNRGHGLPGLVPAAAVRRLAATYPDCLFVTEWWDGSYNSLPANVADWEHVDLAGDAPLPRGRKVCQVAGDIDSPEGTLKVRRLAQTGNVPEIDVWTDYRFGRSLRLAEAFRKYQRD